MKVFLIGFMGAGKSTIGKRLANKLNCKFIDSDYTIEKELNMTVDEIFESEGEKYFREYETNWLSKLENHNTVIALGGGTPCHGANMDLILEQGISVYLVMNAKSLSVRLATSKTVRPLIKNIKDNPKALEAFVEMKLSEREPYYSQANIKIEAINLDANKLDHLVDLIKLGQ